MHTPNPFVYEKSLLADIKSATIPFMLEEHYGQCCEDLIVFSILRALREQGKIPDWSNFYCLEIGANHAFAGSNSYLLNKYTGIPCILVEANPKLLPDLKRARPDATIIHSAVVANDSPNVDFFVSYHNEISSLNKEFVEKWHNGHIGLEEKINVPAIRLNDLLGKYVPQEKKIILLSIDIEGMDLEIAKDLDFNVWRPVIIQMEPSDQFHKDESSKMIKTMQQNGYILLARTRVNLIFIEQSILECLVSP